MRPFGGCREEGKEIEMSAGLKNKNDFMVQCLLMSYQSFHLVLDDHVRVLWLAN